MNWKDKIENNFTIFILSLLFVGFVTGLGAYRGLLEMQRVEVISKLELDNLRTKASAEQNSKNVQLQKYNECQSMIRNMEKQLKEKDLIIINKQNSYEIDIGKKSELISELKNQIKEQANEINQLNKKLVITINKKQEGGKDTESNIRAPKIHKSSVQHPMKAIHMNDFTFEALECKRAGANVYCKIRITNNSPEEKLLIIGGRGYISNPSYLYDKQGNQYKATEVQFGSNSGQDDAGQTLAPSLPVIAIFKFENIPAIGEEVTVRVGSTMARWGGGPYITPVIRNIPISEWGP